jgi:BTB/POZ domain-containing protein 1/2
MVLNPRPNTFVVNNTVSSGGTVASSERRSPTVTSTSTNFSESSHNWQSTKKTVLERMSCIFNRETLADVHFLVGNGDNVLKVPAHKFVLSIGSAVFDAMFNSELAAKESVISLPDVEPAAFLSLLKFLYTDEVSIDPNTVMHTLYTAKKYAVPSLENACVDFLKQNLSSDNAFMLLTQARLFDENALAQTCLECIDKHSVDASEAEGFLEIDHKTLLSVLERDTLSIREVALFNSVVRWSEAECIRRGLSVNPENQRTVLGRAVNLIRFPLMTVEEFASEVAQTGILTDREIVSLFLYFTVNPKPTVDFPDTPRSSITGKEYVVHRFAKTESRWGYSGTSDRIRFMVDRKIYLVGFGLFGSFLGPSSYEVSIQLIHTPTGKVLASNDTSFQCNGQADTFRVLFNKPIEIVANSNYTACATLKGSDSHYGTEGSKKVVVDLSGGKKATFHFQYAAGCNNGTSVEDGQIPEFIFHI